MTGFTGEVVIGCLKDVELGAGFRGVIMRALQQSGPKVWGQCLHVRRQALPCRIYRLPKQN